MKLSTREREILVSSLRKWSDIELADGNVTAAWLLRDLSAGASTSSLCGRIVRLAYSGTRRRE